MKEDASIQPDTMIRGTERLATSPSRDKSVRIMLLAILFQITWPTRLTKEEIFEQLHCYGEHPQKALYRDLRTLTDHAVEDLPDPSDEHLEEWCAASHSPKTDSVPGSMVCSTIDEMEATKSIT